MGAVGVVTPAGAGTFTGPDPTPGVSFSAPLSVATAPAATQGSFFHTGSTTQLLVPAGTALGAYQGILQYTITG